MFPGSVPDCLTIVNLEMVIHCELNCDFVLSTECACFDQGQCKKM